MVEYSIFQDWGVNKGNIKARIVLVLFRLAYLIRHKKGLLIFFFLYLLFYRLFVEWFLNIEIHWNLKAGRGLRLYHGHGIVINGDSTVGKNCSVRQGTTIGNKEIKDGEFSNCPVLGDNVNIGANVCIIGDVVIGDNVIIGAGAIVTKSFPSNCVIAGNPAKILKYTQ